MINKERKIKNGFTLVEMIVSVAIISIAILGIFSVIVNYSQQTQMEKERLIATYLCQEGIEMIKNMRDTNWVAANANWKAGIDNVSPNCFSNNFSPEDASGCMIDPRTGILSIYSASGYLYYGNGYYHHTFLGGDDVKTPFRRKVTITPVGNDELDIRVDVYWMDNTTTIYENIYNWK